MKCIKKKLLSRKGRWAEELPLVLWADRTTPKTSTGQTPFSLVYGCEAVVLVEIALPTSRYGLVIPESISALFYDEIDLVDELRDLAAIRLASYHPSVAKSYNKNVRVRIFKTGDLVLK